MALYQLHARSLLRNGCLGNDRALRFSLVTLLSLVYMAGSNPQGSSVRPSR
jgi:hypothetical protein